MGREIDLDRLRGEIRRTILNLRSVEAALYKSEFIRLYGLTEDKTEIDKLIKAGDRKAVAKWQLTHPEVDVGELSLNKLKELAKHLAIPNYSRMGRTSLATAIESVRKCKQKKA